MKIMKSFRTISILGLLSFSALLCFSPAFCEEGNAWGNLSPQQVNQWFDDEMNLVSKSPQELTPDRLQWGETQLRQMLKDRPAMAPYVKEGDDLWNWVVRQYAGEVSHVEVQWDGSSQLGDRDAGTSFGPPDTKIHVNISANYGGTGSLKGQAQLKGKPKDGPMLWYQTIFELFNTRKSPRFMRVCGRALRGEIPREVFILELDMVEQGTRKDAYDFYENTWIPHCKEISMPYEDDILAEQLKSDTMDFKKEFLPEDRINDLMTRKESDDHYRVYGQTYDSLIAPDILRK